MAVTDALAPALPRQVDFVPGRSPLASVIPGIDALALVGAASLSGHLDRLALAYGAVAFVVLASAGSHRARINPRLTDDLPALIGGLAVPLLIVAPFFGADAVLAHFVRLGSVTVAMVLLGRAVSYTLVREARARGYVRERTLVVGAGTLGVKAARTLQDHPEFGLIPIGFLDSFDETSLPLPILGDVTQLEAVVRQHAVSRVIVAFGATREPAMVPILRACDRVPVEVHVMPRFFELGVASEGPLTDDLWGIPLIRLRRSALRSATWHVKRAFDLVAGSLILLLSSPVFAAAALAVRLSGPGPVFFRQQRIGQRGQIFELLKFRTLQENSDSDTTWTVSDDERRTVPGKVLRATGLDELPQLINVLRGEMSLVGPRPERPFFVDRFRVAVQGYEDRHRVPAGITGWAQVHGLRGDTSIEERATFDNHYVENWSLWRDLVILVRTVGTLLRHTGS